MRYKVKSVAALQTILSDLPDQMQVEVDSDLGVSAKNIGELRNLTSWPSNLAITMPPERRPKSTTKNRQGKRGNSRFAKALGIGSSFWRLDCELHTQAQL